MIRLLLLLFALFVLGSASSYAAGRPTRYARAKMHGKMYVHRPFYKRYKGHNSHKKRFFLFRHRGGSSGPSYRVGRHSTR